MKLKLGEDEMKWDCVTGDVGRAGKELRTAFIPEASDRSTRARGGSLPGTETSGKPILSVY